jgi:hypothetical protein
MLGPAGGYALASGIISNQILNLNLQAKCKGSDNFLILSDIFPKPYHKSFYLFFPNFKQTKIQ